jgi:phospholipid N-methyltransferase
MPKSQTSVCRASASSRRFLFALNFFKSPAMLGSLIPSSRFLVNDVLNHVDWDRARVIVEYGPGVGTITQEILKRMRPDAVLLALELNEDFVAFLREEIVDPRLHAVHASASDVRQALASLELPSADYIISGIPYSTMPHALRREVMQESRQVLHPKGALLVYQFTNAVLPYLKSSFGSVRQNFQFLNILPARIFYCTP